MDKKSKSDGEFILLSCAVSDLIKELNILSEL